jgi:hypothetical protein
LFNGWVKVGHYGIFLTEVDTKTGASPPQLAGVLKSISPTSLTVLFNPQGGSFRVDSEVNGKPVKVAVVYAPVD